MSEPVLLVDHAGAVALIVLNRPKARNALSPELVKALGAVLRSSAEDEAVRAVVLTGAGGAFCAGADLKAAMTDRPRTSDGIGKAIDEYHAMIRSIVEAPKPV